MRCETGHGAEKDVGETIVVKVDRGGRVYCELRKADARGECYVGECSITIVAVKDAGRAIDARGASVDIAEAIVVKVKDEDSARAAAEAIWLGETGGHGNILE